MDIIKKITAGVALMTALMVGAGVPFSGVQALPLITNGSFEDPGTVASLGAGSTFMPGWTVVTSGQVDAALILMNGSSDPSIGPSNGAFFLDLTGSNDQTPPYAVGVTQYINTVANQQYTLSFDLGSTSNYGIPAKILASAGNASFVFTSTLTGVNNWEQETLTFTALGPSTLISLTGDFAQYGYIGLDNVSVTATPLPAALPLFASVLGVLGLLGWRRKRKAAAALAAT